MALRTGTYGHLVIKENFLLPLVDDIYVIYDAKLKYVSFNRRQAPQMKNYGKMKEESKSLFTVERKLNHVEKPQPSPTKGKKVASTNGPADDGWVVLLHNCSTETIMVDRNAVALNGSHELSSFQRSYRIAIGDNLLCWFVDSRPTVDEANPAFVNEGYRVNRLIGSGYSGNVFSSFSMERMRPCALKRVNKKLFAHYEGLDYLDEVKILKMLKTLNHPNIIKLFDSHDTPNFLYLELEFASGDTLWERLYGKGDSRNALKQAQAKCVMYQLLSALVCLHRCGVTHRDIKPENMLLMSCDVFPLMKLADFGTSHSGSGDDVDVMTATAGTVEYAAPEMLKLKNTASEEGVDDVIKTPGYSKSVDCWSVGVVTYESLTARQPFTADDDIEDKIYAGDFQFFADDWTDIENPEVPKHLIRSLLRPEVGERLTAQQAIDHPWFTSDDDFKQRYARLMSQWRVEHNL